MNVRLLNSISATIQFFVLYTHTKLMELILIQVPPYSYSHLIKYILLQIKNMGIDTREKVHQIEFLSLVAFVARERQRVSHDMITQSKFTHNDLAMAYAFQRQYGEPQRKVPSSYHITKPPMMDGIRKSFTDSPLSQYQPAIMRESQIESPLYPHSDELTSTLQQDNPDSQTSETGMK